MKAIFLAFFVVSSMWIGTTVQAQSALLGKRLVSKGDEIARVRDAAGTPDKLDKIDADDSSPAMEIWTYTRKDRVITLWVVGGKVVQLEDRRLEGAGGGSVAARATPGATP